MILSSKINRELMSPNLDKKALLENDNNVENNGICNCKKKCVPKNKKCYIVSFMIFRTGSVLIVGQCNENVLYKIYKFISNIL